jgi:signal transduction histidine kinase
MVPEQDSIRKLESVEPKEISIKGMKHKVYPPVVLTLFISGLIISIEVAIMVLLRHLTGYTFWVRTLIDAFVLALLVGPVIYLLFLRLIRREKELSQEIVKREEVERILEISGGKLQSLSLRLLDCYEIERKRIARELHDELGSGLAVVKLRLNRISKFIKTAPDKAMEECQITLDYVDKVIENIYRVTKDMTPDIIEDFGLTAGIRSLIHDLSETCAINIRAEITDLDSLFKSGNRTKQILVYRMIQECLTNVVKHAAAKNVSIAIHRDGDQAIGIVEDDGKGFDVGELHSTHPETRGVGLKNMNERVRLAGGSLDVWSQEGKGTRITFKVPIDEDQECG